MIHIYRIITIVCFFMAALALHTGWVFPGQHYILMGGFCLVAAEVRRLKQ